MDDQPKGKTSRPKSRQSLAHVPSKSNTTTDIAALKQAEEAKSKSKRSRGKSLGPGGLEALTETSGNAFKVAPTFQPKSILKPSIPLTPPKAIPSFDELRSRNTNKARSPAKNVAEDLLIDFSTPGTSHNAGPGGMVPGAEVLADPFSPIVRPNPDSAQQAQAVDEQERQRQERKKAILEQRAARRKSLGARRVSFAPEATLHTWSVMELVEDSTTSSASNSTRRQSAMTAAQSPAPAADTPAKENERPTTPVEQHPEGVGGDTPPSQRELHQRKRRRTSENTQSSDDETFSSPGDGADSSPMRVEDSIDSESESDTDGDTAMSLDEITQNTVRSTDSSATQTSLDDRLRQAASQAGTRGIAYDENGSDLEPADGDGDQSMELADGTVTHAFRQYAQNSHANGSSAQNHGDGEDANHFHNQPIPYPDLEAMENDETTTGLTMDMTRAVGGIMPKSTSDSTRERLSRRRSNVSRRESSGADTSYGDETMDMTVAKGGILSNIQDGTGATEPLSDDEMTMEMTKAIGGIRNSGTAHSTSSPLTEETELMDMTMAAGGILPPIEEQTEPQSVIDGEITSAMEMTRAVGKILPQMATDAEDEPTAAPVHAASPSPSAQLGQELDQAVVETTHTSRQMAPVASETGSPTLQPRLSARRATPSSRSTTPRPVQKAPSPDRIGQTTPSKQLTPAPLRSVSPKRTPILTANVAARSASPKKLFAKEIQQRASPAANKSPLTKRSPARQRDPLFSKDEHTGLHTPRVVLHAPKPHQHLRRRSSGIGIDNEGTGSPTVSEILAKRQSISDLVPEFQLHQTQERQSQLEDPQQIEHEVDAERAEEHRRESGRFIMEQEASEQLEENCTQSLKEMIESMTPKTEKKTKQKGRKSLAMGSARGLLGKRPAELDMDDEDVDITPKRLKAVSREGSPVKKVHLPKPPTKEETTGRLSKLEIAGLAATAHPVTTPTLSQTPERKVKSPERTGRFKSPVSAQKPTSFEERLDNVVGATDVATVHPETAKETIEEKISLQEFLNMTNIHFIELSTTKRRHTMAQPAGDTTNGSVDGTSQASFVAAATTLPLLDLYQHATRELKSYISSGRKIIRQIEAETLADQPAIFKQYVDARPDEKAVMDNQFRNGKTNARLQSKEGWYTWRGQLVDGLHTGLEGIRTDMQKDREVLDEQQQALQAFVPQLNSRKQQLEQQLRDLRRRASELDSVDHDCLKERRQELAAIGQEVLRRAQHADKLKRQMQEKDEILASATELQQEMNSQINEAIRVQEEQRKWPAKDVTAYKTNVERLEQGSGWRLLTAEEEGEEADHDIVLTLRYQRQLRLTFYPSAFQPKSDAGRRRSGRKSRSVSGPTAPITLSYMPDEDDDRLDKELTTELQFFLQLIQGQLQAFAMMPKGAVTCRSVLKTVSEGWTLARKVASEIRELQSAGIVRTTVLDNEKLSTNLMLMQPDRSRIDIDFTVVATPLKDGELSISTVVTASPTYGAVSSVMDASKTRKVQTALSKEIESRILGESSWINAVRGFEEWLQAQVQRTEPEMEKLKPNPTAKPQPKPQSQPQELTTSVWKPQPVRARTTSPQAQQSTTPKKPPPRSPLAPKTTNSKVTKKSIPIPKKPVSFSTSQHESLVPPPANFRESTSQQKENFVPAAAKVIETQTQMQDIGELQVNGKTIDENMSYDEAFGLKNGIKPAITPEMQEVMMNTPLKRRVGALRRSPV